MSRWRLALLLFAGAAYAVASHWLMVRHASAPWAVAVLLVPLWLGVLGVAAARFGRGGAFAALGLGAALLVLVCSERLGQPNHLYLMQHIGVNTLLAVWFGASLRSGRLSLIGEFAQRIHPLSPAQRLYTTQVTRVWALYFVLVSVVSLALFLAAPFAVWSLFANVLTPVFVVLLFLGEYLLRYRLHPEFERTPLFDAVRAFYAGPSAGGARR